MDTRELQRATELLGAAFVTRSKTRLLEDDVGSQHPLFRSLTDHDRVFQQDLECSICFEPFTEPLLTGCGHTFCRECIEEVMKGSDEGQNAQLAPCNHPAFFWFRCVVNFQDRSAVQNPFDRREALCEKGF